MKDFTISIPCKNHIRKYFTSQYGDPLLLSHESSFGDTIITKLRHPPIMFVNKRILAIAFKDFNTEIKFMLPFHWFYRLNKTPSQQQVFRINQFMEKTFTKDLCNTTKYLTLSGMQIKKAIEFFTDQHSIIIDTDISLDSLIKTEYRSRVLAQQKKNSAAVVRRF